ncbi:MAG: hypothetical protein GX646_03140 [Bacteroidales bacterium]|nr:hypothetical protein [Bacteroidales bacterium]
MNKKTLTQVIGWEPNAALIELILADVQASGISIEEAASKYSLPVMVMPSDNGMIHELGETYTVEQFKERFPFRKIITITNGDL